MSKISFYTGFHLTFPFIQLNLHFNIKARFEKDTRYYTIYLQQDLLKDWVVVADNGRIGSKMGKRRTTAFPTHQEAFEHLCTIATIRYKRNYLCVNFSTDSYFFNCFLCQRIDFDNLQAEPIPRARKTPMQKALKDPKINLDSPPMQQYPLCF